MSFKKGSKVRATVNLGYPDVKIPKGTKGVVIGVARNPNDPYPYSVRFNNDTREWLVNAEEIEKRLF